MVRNDTEMSPQLNSFFFHRHIIDMVYGLKRSVLSSSYPIHPDTIDYDTKKSACFNQPPPFQEHPLYARWVTHLEPMEALLCAGHPSYVFTSFKPPPPPPSSGPSPTTKANGETVTPANGTTPRRTRTTRGTRPRSAAARRDAG